MSSTLYSQTPESGFWSFQFENDLWGSNDDRFYTHGMEFSYATTKKTPSVLAAIKTAMPFYEEGKIDVHGYTVGQKIFTPLDITQQQLIEDDRPYAGWLFVGTGIADVFENADGEEVINGMLFCIGVVGPASLAEHTQNRIHHVFDSETPKGWDNQLQNELGFNALYMRKWRNVYSLESHKQLELSHHYVVTIGNVYTYATAGGMLRWGTMLQNDIGPPTIRPGFPGLPAFKPNPDPNWYLYGGIEIRAVAHNIFLDGNTLQDSHSVEKETWVGDMQFGVAFHVDGYRISFSNLLRTEEFVGQSEKTRYGAINITVSI